MLADICGREGHLGDNLVHQIASSRLSLSERCQALCVSWRMGSRLSVLVEALTLILRSEQPAERGELGKALPVTSDSYVEGLGVQL